MAATLPFNRSLVTIEVAGKSGDNRNINGILQESTGKSLILISGQDIPAAARVNVRTQDRVYLGEVLNSTPEHGAKWTIHVLTRRTFMVV